MRFAFRLATRLGVWNVNEMLRRMTAEQLRSWQMYEEVEPFSEERQDYRIGALMTLIANINRNPKKVRTPFSVEDCVPRFGDNTPKAKPKADWHRMKALAMALTAESREKPQAPKRRTRRVS